MVGLLPDNVELFPLLVSFASLGVSLSFSLWVIIASFRRNKVHHHNLRENGDDLGSFEKGETEMRFSSTDQDGVHSPPALVLVSWRSVCCSYPKKKRRQQQQEEVTDTNRDSVVTLTNSYGEVLSGEVAAIMGPRYVNESFRSERGSYALFFSFLKYFSAVEARQHF